MGDDRDTLAGLGWEKEIRSLGEPDVPFISSPECDDYELTPFLQSTEAKWWRMHEKHKQNVKKVRWRADVQKKEIGRNEDGFVNDDKTTNNEVDEKEVVESSKFLSFRERLRGLPPYSLTLNDRLKNKMVPYIDLFRPDPPPSRRDDDTSRKMIKQK